MDPNKPLSTVYHRDITRLPELTLARRVFRKVIHGIGNVVVHIFTRIQEIGFENIPANGPALIVFNHLGDSDVLIGGSMLPVQAEALAKVELFDMPFIGKFLDAYGVIWVHRGQPDRKALRIALRGLAEGRFIAIAPEARESTTGGLEPGTEGAAYLALKAAVAVVPVTLTGTENWRIFGNMKRFHRTRVTMEVGTCFYLDQEADFRSSVKKGTEKIMVALANQLPENYRGAYQHHPEVAVGRE